MPEENDNEAQAVAEPTREERRAAIEAERAKRHKAANDAKEDQYTANLEEIDALEKKRGTRLYILRTGGYVEGLPAAIAIALPPPGVYKRMSDKVFAAAHERKESVAAAKQKNASEELSRECWVWPSDPKTREAMLEKWPSILDAVGGEINKLMKLEAEEEGKE